MAKRRKPIEYPVRDGDGNTLMLRDAPAVAYRADPEEEAEELRATTRLSGKNQITLPVAMVRALAWRAGDEVDLLMDGDEIWLRRRRHGTALLDSLQGALAHVAEWRTKEGIDAWVRGERENWDREWDSDTKPSTRESAD